MKVESRLLMRLSLLLAILFVINHCQSWSSFWDDPQRKDVNGFEAQTSGPRRHLIVTANTNQTCIFDEDSLTMRVGPALLRSTNVPQIWRIPSGPQAGKILVIHGDGTNTTSLFNPADESIEAGPLLSAAAWGNALAFEDAMGRWMVLHSGDTSASLYIPSVHQFWSTTPGQQITNSRAAAVYLASGTQSGSHWIIYGMGTSATSYAATSILSYSNGPSIPQTLGPNSVVFSFTQGPLAGRTRVLEGNGNANVYEFNPDATPPNITNPLTTGLTPGAGSLAFPVRSGTYQGAFVVLQGGGTANARLMLSDGTWSILFSASYTTTSGAHAIEIDSGPWAGRTLLTAGNSFNVTHYFDPASASFSASAGPVLTMNLGSVTKSVAYR